MDNRVGIFRLTGNEIRDYPEHVKRIMAECIILRCEHLYIGDMFEYVALSELFAENPAGNIPPPYQFMVGETVTAVPREFQNYISPAFTKEQE